jgi:hypothetical protein
MKNETRSQDLCMNRTKNGNKFHFFSIPLWETRNNPLLLSLSVYIDNVQFHFPKNHIYKVNKNKRFGSNIKTESFYHSILSYQRCLCRDTSIHIILRFQKTKTNESLPKLNTIKLEFSFVC